MLNASSGVPMSSSSSASSQQNLIVFHDQIKKHNSSIHSNLSRNMPSLTTAISTNQSSAAAMQVRRTNNCNSPHQVLNLSSDEEIMDDSLVGK